MAVDVKRHLEVFSPEKFGDKRVDVIGAGAIGSCIALELANLGVKNLHVWDFDHVEEHNLPNQVFGLEHVGQPKVEALANIIKRDVDSEITIHNEAVDGNTRNLGEVVFLVTDTMSSRSEIAKEAIQFNARTNLLVEARMGAEMGMVHTINPNNLTEVNGFNDTLYSDDDVKEESACGASITVGATAKMMSSYSVWQMLKWFAGDDDLPNSMTICMRPHLLMTKNFSD